MAKLGTFDIPAKAEGETWREHFVRQEEWVRELEADFLAKPADEIVGGILRFPIADGYATYIVTKESPLTIAHLPIGDAWTIDPAYIRGLKKTDILARLTSARRLAELFSRKG